MSSSSSSSSSDKIFRSRFPYTKPDDNANMGLFMLESFEYHHDKVLIVDCASKREWTGQQLKEASIRVASGLLDKSQIKKGDKVFMMCPHSDHEFIFFVGAILTGATIYGSTADDGYGEHRTLCNIVTPNVLVASYRLHNEMVQLVRDIQAANPQHEQLARIVWIDTSDNPICDNIDAGDLTSTNDDNTTNNNDDTDYQDIIERDRVIVYYDDLLNYKHQHLDKIKDILDNQIDPHKDAAFLVLTSGSTGQPKVVYQTHYCAVAGPYALMVNPRTRQQADDQTSTKQHQNSDTTDNVGYEHMAISDRGQIWYLDENSVVSGDLPLDHAAGTVSMFVSIHKGCKLLIMTSYDIDIFWKNVSEYKITDCMASSTFTHKLLTRFNNQLQKGDKFYRDLDISSLQTIFCCGSRIASIDLVQDFTSRHHNLAILQGYGSTETGFISLLVRGQHVGYLNSVGYLAPGVTAKVVDPDTGKLVGKNELGELFIKCPANFHKYYGGEKMQLATEAVYDCDKFYQTGDQVYFDDCERLFVIGRYKDTLFLNEDWKILPKELEDIVEQHPLVAECCIVGLPDPDIPSCHAPRAYVKLRKGATGCYIGIEKLERINHGPIQNGSFSETMTLVSDKDIFDFVAERVAKPKYIRGGVRFLDDWPRNGVLGKIDRKQLREMA